MSSRGRVTPRITPISSMSVRTTAVWIKLGRRRENNRIAPTSSRQRLVHVLAYNLSATVSYKSSLGGGRVESTAKPINSTLPEVISRVCVKNGSLIDIKCHIRAEGTVSGWDLCHSQTASKMTACRAAVSTRQDRRDCPLISGGNYHTFVLG